ncbi:MAG: cytochrome c biogenesis protein CcsA [Deltaproteobacteria bacterium]|nr:cytochrome c biogenesis protein CcsA [Deltaproteobacteria bacterium]
MSPILLAAAFAVYLAATAGALVLAGLGRAWLRRLVLGAGWSGLGLHTAGLAWRWYEAGVVELLAAEKALGRQLAGLERLEVLLSHPPFTNMYESLVFFAWSLVLVTLVAERIGERRRFWVLGVIAMVFADLSMGLASLSLDRQIAPLVPALQSWWLYIHVITAFLAYACFLLAAAAGLLFLLRDGVPGRSFGLGAAALGLLVCAALAGGVPWPERHELSVALLGDEGVCLDALGCRGVLPPYDCEQGRCTSQSACDPARPCPAHHRCIRGRCALARSVEVVDARRGRPVRIGLPGATGLLAASAAAFLLALLGFAWRRPGRVERGAALLCAVGLALLVAAGLWAWREAAGVDLSAYAHAALVPPEVDGSTHLSLRSAPYRLALGIFCCLAGVFCLLVCSMRERLERALPALESLDRLVYRAVKVGFPLMTLAIVTGAVWAQYAWGRYWGWDPKETWSLVAWIVYAVYLHARLVHGWKGRRAVLVAIAGFAVVVFTFLGVNMGLTGSGLHTYGGPSG